MSPLPRRRAALYLAGIFLLGGLAGGVVGYGAAKRRPGSLPRPEDMAAHIQDKLRSELALTDVQVSEINPIVLRTCNKVQELHQGAMEQVAATIKASHQEIGAHLSPDQRIKLETSDRERDERWRKSSDGHGKHP